MSPDRCKNNAANTYGLYKLIDFNEEILIWNLEQSIMEQGIIKKRI